MGQSPSKSPSVNKSKNSIPHGMKKKNKNNGDELMLFSPPGWQGTITHISAVNVQNAQNVVVPIHEAGSMGMRLSGSLFCPSLLKYAAKGIPRATQNYVDPMLHLYFHIDNELPKGPYETQMQNRWPPEYDLRWTLNSIGQQGWTLTGAFGTEPLVLVMQRKIGDVFQKKQYNYIACPCTMSMGVAHIHEHGNVRQVHSVQAALDFENENGWKLAFVWQHDEQEPAALIMERVSEFDRFVSKVVSATMKVVLHATGEWKADYQEIDDLVSKVVKLGWTPGGMLVLPRVYGKGRAGTVFVNVLLIFQARVEAAVVEEFDRTERLDNVWNDASTPPSLLLLPPPPPQHVIRTLSPIEYSHNEHPSPNYNNNFVDETVQVHSNQSSPLRREDLTSPPPMRERIDSGALSRMSNQSFTSQMPRQYLSPPRK